jgi:hypothetical protein
MTQLQQLRGRNGVLIARTPKANAEQAAAPTAKSAFEGGPGDESACQFSSALERDGKTSILIVIGGKEPMAVATALAMAGWRLYEQHRFDPAFDNHIEVRITSALTPDTPDMREALDAAVASLIARTHVKGRAVTIDLQRD